MDKFVIEGGVSLHGKVTVSGSKNAALPIMAASLLCAGKSVLHHVPDLVDIQTMAGLLEKLGATVSRDGDTLTIDAEHINQVEATYDIVRKMRASFWVLGPLLARFGRARVSLPGGCAIGARPVDLHIKGLEALGATIRIEHGYVDVTAPAGGLVGNRIVLDMPSVGATEHIMMAAALARGTTVIENAAREPEVLELAEVLNYMGARVSGEGTGHIQIEGADALRGMNARIGPDRIECGTLLAAATITGGDVVLEGVRVTDMSSVFDRFSAMGAKITPLSNPANARELVAVRVQGPERILAIDVQTAPFPGYPTDMQAQLMACLTLADGTSQIEETIFENRFMHAQELVRMGADITLHGNLAVVKGVDKLLGAPVMATDLRASASLILAALKAEGTTEVLRIYHLDRGYSHLEHKLQALGGRVTRVAA